MYLINIAMSSLYTSIARYLRPTRNARATLHVILVSRSAEVCQSAWLTGAVLQVSYWMDGLVSRDILRAGLVAARDTLVRPFNNSHW